MIPKTMQISVYDGSQLVEVRVCTLMQLPDGRKAAIYRGLAFPLLPSGDSINIAGEAHPSVASAPPDFPTSEKAPDVRYAIIPGVDQAYVLVAGSMIDGEKAAADLRRAGVHVLRTGRYLGDAVGGLVADWFIRVVPSGDGEALSDRVAQVLGPIQPRQHEPTLRLRLLAAELAQARERALRSEAEVTRLRSVLTNRSSLDDSRAADPKPADQNGAPPESAAADDGSAEQTAAKANAQLPLRPTRAPKRILDEIEDVLVALLPRIRLLRQCIDVVAVEYADRRGLYRVLAELDRCETAMPPRWKTVQGVESWIEKSKVGNGRDSQGRVYARLDRTDRSWQVLVSHKSEQERDLAWLRRQ